MENDQEILKKFFSQGGSLRMLVDVSKDDLDKIYAYANKLFSEGSFKNAKQFYFLLARFDHWCFNYWLALGLCCQRLSQHEEAVFCFGRAGYVNPDDPHAPFYAGMSYELMGNAKYAFKAFEAALRWCDGQPRYAEIKVLAARALERNLGGARS